MHRDLGQHRGQQKSVQINRQFFSRPGRRAGGQRDLFLAGETSSRAGPPFAVNDRLGDGGRLLVLPGCVWDYQNGGGAKADIQTAQTVRSGFA